MKRALASPAAVGLGLVMSGTALICSFSLTLASRTQFSEFKHTIYQRCLQRQAYDESNHASVEADADLYQQLLDISREAPANPDPRVQALVGRQQQVIREAQQRKETAAKAGVIGSCSQYR